MPEGGRVTTGLQSLPYLRSDRGVEQARRLVSGVLGHALQPGVDVLMRGLDVGAAGMKEAPTGTVDERRRPTGDLDQLLV